MAPFLVARGGLGVLLVLLAGLAGAASEPRDGGIAETVPDPRLAELAALVQGSLDVSVDPQSLFEVSLSDEDALQVEVIRLRALLDAVGDCDPTQAAKSGASGGGRGLSGRGDQQARSGGVERPAGSRSGATGISLSRPGEARSASSKPRRTARGSPSEGDRGRASRPRSGGRAREGAGGCQRGPLRGRAGRRRGAGAAGVPGSERECRPCARSRWAR